MDKLLFGTAGIPISTDPSNTVNGVKRVKELGLGCMELEFVRNVNISKELAPEVKKAAIEKNVVLSAHGSYFINLNAKEREKVEKSIERILHAAKTLHLCGGISLVFHAGYYFDDNRSEVYKTIRERLENITNVLKSEGMKIYIRPETTGKETQFGTLEEILQLSSELDQVLPCVDFSHLHARSNGKLNSYDEFVSVLSKIEKSTGRKGIENMHIHLSGIEYTDKGERKHLNLKNSDFKYRELLKALKEFNARGVVISESPNIEEDALLLQETYKKT